MRCTETKDSHDHEWDDDDVAWSALECLKCGETVLEYAKRRPDLAESIEGITPQEVYAIEHADRMARAKYQMPLDFQ